MEIPETINTQTLVKDLAKEIRLVEVNCKKKYNVFFFRFETHVSCFGL